MDDALNATRAAVSGRFYRARWRRGTGSRWQDAGDGLVRVRTMIRMPASRSSAARSRHRCARSPKCWGRRIGCRRKGDRERQAELRFRRTGAEEYGDMLKAGVIDPTKVVRIALEKRRVHSRDN